MLTNAMPRYEPLSAEALATIHGGWERLGREVRELERHGRHPDEAARILRHHGRRALVLRPDDVAGEATVLHAVPPGALLREHLDVHAGLVHRGDAGWADDAVA